MLLCHFNSFYWNWVFDNKDKEIYRWPIKESIKAMLAWEWNIEKAREEEESEKKKATARKISQTAQVPTIKKKNH